MDQRDRIAELVEPALNAMGYDLVRVRLTGNRSPTLQVMAERSDRAEITVDDCADISRNISAILDAEDPLPGSYTLEVSSPGIDRPLVRLPDFERFAGFEARLESRVPVDGRKRFRGKLAGVEEGCVRIAVRDDTFVVPFEDVHSAKLVLTDELIAASRPGRDAPRPDKTGERR